LWSPNPNPYQCPHFTCRRRTVNLASAAPLRRSPIDSALPFRPSPFPASSSLPVRRCSSPLSLLCSFVSAVCCSFVPAGAWLPGLLARCKLVGGRRTHHMESFTQQKVQRYEEFVDHLLKPDLQRAIDEWYLSYICSFCLFSGSNRCVYIPY
ncbi:hypothetical protein S83_067043, partial [Arachis hypogaea]